MNEDDQFIVVVNHEEQYSIWPSDREIPDGWRPVGHSGTRGSCLEYIDKVWTDIRPLSMRRAADASTQRA
jgi:MbtH protein